MSPVTRGILFMVAATFVFAVMDGLSRLAAERYSVILVVMVRYWFFAGFVLVRAMTAPGGIRAAARTHHPFLQVLRGVMLAAEVVVTVTAFVWLGLIETHALFASYPLMIAALSGPVLGERVGWRRWAGIAVGFAGVLIILDPGNRVLEPQALIALAGALIFALYGLITRKVSARDSATTSLFWTGAAGAVAMTLIGAFYWQPIAPADWPLIGVLSVAGLAGHWLLIKSYGAAPASTVQPFAFLQLVFIAGIGVTFFSEDLRPGVVIGAGLVVAAGLFTLSRSRPVSAPKSPPAG